MSSTSSATFKLYKEYPQLPDYHSLCEQALQKWSKEQTFSRSLEQRDEQKAKTWVFYEGPPSANGPAWNPSYDGPDTQRCILPLLRSSGL